MLKEFIAKLQTLSREAVSVDASRFQDPIASQTTWTPAKSGGANFRTHKLIEIDMNRLEFRASVGAKIFYSVFLLIGTITFIASLTQDFISDTALIIPMFIGLVFAVVGGCLFYFGTAPIVFDKYKGAYWKGWKSPENVYTGNSLKNYTRLVEIHALQLISEYCRGNKTSYYSYELNLVLKNGNRINVVDHGNPNKLREDAQTLSQFLGKPVWDAI